MIPQGPQLLFGWMVFLSKIQYHDVTRKVMFQTIMTTEVLSRLQGTYSCGSVV